MLITEIEEYLQVNYILDFVYQNTFFMIRRKKHLFHSEYILLSVGENPQCYPTIQELFEHACLRNRRLFGNAQKSVFVPSLDNPLWKTYEGIMHRVLFHNAEIYFEYAGVWYWITHFKHYCFLTNEYDGSSYTFTSPESLFSTARIGGKSLHEIWNAVEIDSYI